MPKSLQKILQIYISKLKRTTTNPKSDEKVNTGWVFSGCKYPKTPSFSLQRSSNASRKSDPLPPAEALADAEGFFFRNFNSVYASDDSDLPPEFTSNSGSQSSGFSTDSNRFADLPPDFYVDSQRFFVSPGASNSILDKAALPGDGIAVMTYSPDPYADFRRSMEEMVRARDTGRQPAVDWNFMEELLLCYLKLNENESHEFILRAFFDLLTTLSPEIEKQSPYSGEDC